MTKQVKPSDIAGQLKNGETVHILDVRENNEVSEGKISGAKHIPLGHLALRKNELNKDNKYVVVCQSGNRSKAACGILGVLGYEVEDMVGGMQAWEWEVE